MQRTTALTLLCLLFTIAATTGCPPRRTLVLFDPATGVLPQPDPNEMLQTTYDGPVGRTRISVFPGTSLPGEPLTASLLMPADADPVLGGSKNDVGVRLGPDETQFNQPVRVSLLLGDVVKDENDNFVVPNVQAFTAENGMSVELPAVQTQVTPEGSIINHVLVSHFSDVMMRAGAGILLGIQSPDDGQQFVVGEPIMTGLRATNNADVATRLQPIERVHDNVGNLNYDQTNIVLDAMSSFTLGDGTCNCTDVGFGTVEYEVKGDHKDSGEIDPTLVLFDYFVRIQCVGIRTTMTVTFNAEEHTTHYFVHVYRTSPTGGGEEDITFGSRTEYRWTSGSLCGTFDNPGDDPRNFYNHTDCSGADEERARVSVEVTYTTEDGNTTKREYTASARANEGAGPVNF